MKFYLLIFESIGTQELILVGIIALIVFGPRKLPEMARKAGSLMRELRSVSTEFRSTWAKEVKAAEEQANEFIGFESDTENKILPQESIIEAKTVRQPAKDSSILPSVRELSEEDYKKLIDAKNRGESDGIEAVPAEDKKIDDASDKKNWL